MSITYLATPLSKNRWKVQVFVNSQEITDSARNCGLLQLIPDKKLALLQRWAGSAVVKCCLVRVATEFGYLPVFY